MSTQYQYHKTSMWGARKLYLGSWGILFSTEVQDVDKNGKKICSTLIPISFDKK